MIDTIVTALGRKAGCVGIIDVMVFRRKCYAMSCSPDFSFTELSYSLCAQVLMCALSLFPLLFLRFL